MGSNREDDVLARQAERNSQTRDGWDRFAPHRRQVASLLTAPEPNQRESLCVLGAGNCNDLDLQFLLAIYGKVHLVDVDGDAMRVGVSRQGFAGDSRVCLHDGIDFSGLLSADPAVQQAGTDWSDVVEETEILGLPPACDVVTSLCTLTQILEMAGQRVDPALPEHLDLVKALRLRHLRLMLEQLTPGGIGVLVTDLVSSKTCPALLEANPQNLSPLVRQLIEQRNFFTGVNPAVLHALFSSDPSIASHVTNLEMIDPWLWDLGPRVYAVYGVRFQKQG